MTFHYTQLDGVVGGWRVKDLPPGRFAVMAAVPDRFCAAMAHPAAELDELLGAVEREFRIKPAHRTRDSTHARLTNEVVDIAAGAPGGEVDALTILHLTTWMAFNRPNGAARRQFEAMVAVDAAVHISMIHGGGQDWLLGMAEVFVGGAPAEPLRLTHDAVTGRRKGIMSSARH